VRRLLQWPNTVFAWSIFLAVSLLNIVLGVICQLVALPFDAQRRVSLKINHWIWGRGLFLAEPGWPTTWEGLENVGEGPYVIVANHSSVLDIPVLMGLPIPMRVMAKKKIVKAPVMGWYMGFSGQIPIDLSSPEGVMESVELCRKSLDEGISVVIFPEGSRSEACELQKFRTGAFRLAKDSGVPVLPCSIFGTHRILKKGDFRAQSLYSPIRCRVMPPISGADLSTARKLKNRAYEAVATNLAEIRLDA